LQNLLAKAGFPIKIVIKMAIDFEIEGFWQVYLNTLPPGSVRPTTYQSWYFGSTAEMAAELGDLVRRGVKTATCSLLWEHDLDSEPLPQVGDVCIITDWDGHPLCIIEISDVQVRAFRDVDEQFALDEGEGDRTLAYWREEHWRYFSAICNSLGRKPDESMPLVCERFRLLFS
jgi:uncharacterized protein YhfF